MKSLNKNTIQNQYAKLMKHNDADKEVAHLSQMLMFRILGEVDKICEERSLSKKDLANLIGVSPSYLTQLYRGNSKLNFETVGKFEHYLNMRFDVSCVAHEILEICSDVENSWDDNQINSIMNKFNRSEGMWMFKSKKFLNRNDELDSNVTIIQFDSSVNNSTIHTA